ncbi:MAG: hypothetical protein WCV69_02700 [Patescibacteria group bacterium]|jgi:hypothetical protein
MLTFSRPQHNAWQILLLILILVNIFLFKSAILGIIVGVIFLWYNSKKAADIFFPQVHQGLKNLFGLLLIMAVICATYTIAYHLYKINLAVFLLTLLTIPLVIELLSFFGKKEHYFLENFSLKNWKPNNWKNLLLPCLVLLIDALLVYYLFHKASSGLIRSPWELVSFKFWCLLGLSNLALVWTILNKKSSKNIYLIVAHFLLLSSITLILYRLGYGYDSFIHGATLKIIENTGTIQPRLYIYVGQYGLSLFFSKLWQVDVLMVNKLLLPVLFSLLWPSSIFYGLRHSFKWSYRMSYLGVLLSSLVGFSYFIMTSPQSLSFLFVVLVVFIAPELRKNEIPFWLSFILALMTMTIHPISGIPLFFMAFILSFDYLLKSRNLKKVINIIIYSFSAITLPIFLGVYQWVNGVSANNIINRPLKWPWPNLNATWVENYDFPFDWLHNIGQNLSLIYFMVAIIGLYLILANHKITFFRNQLILLGILLSNYILTKSFINFNLQISYQKDDYPNRILFLIALCALPIFLTSFYYLFHHYIKKQPTIINGIWISVIVTIALLVSTYFSYPVYDRYLNTKSANVTSADLQTVQYIEEDAHGEPYVVLANQMVGAAAIHELGFANYYNDNFFYSMPLGNNNIYQEFLTMIESDASRQTANQAMDKAQVKRLYLVVNNYWHSSKSANQQASASADEVIPIANGTNMVYLYLK